MSDYVKEPYVSSEIINVTMLEINEDLKILGGLATAKNTGYSLRVEDNKQTFYCDSASSQIFTLPTVEDADIGISFTIIKMGSGALRVIPQATEYIEDGGIGDEIYCDDTTPAIITLMLVYGSVGTTKVWKILAAQGTWVTTD